jgi:hypothetical protein
MSDEEAKQELEWQILYDRISQTLDRFGKRDAFGKGDYWLVDDNWGWHRQQVEIQNLKMLAPEVIELLQRSLADFEDWDITVRVDVPGSSHWPAMGIVIARDEIVDELKREFLPAEFRDLNYSSIG